MKHILQSEIWQEFEKMEGEEVFALAGEGFMARGVVKNTPVGKYLYAKYGPELEKKSALKPALEALRKLAQERGAIFVRIEPTLEFSEKEMKKMGCVRSKEIDPEHTWVLDLTAPEEEILAGIEARKMRYFRNYAKKGMSIRKTKNSEEITILMDLLRGLGERDHFTPQEETHLKRQMEAGFATLYVVELEKMPIAAALVYDYEGVRYYAHAATDETHRKLMAGTILLIQMILDAKREGAAAYDFWGVTISEDPKHPWYGFTQYKKSFGGELVTYTGTYDLVVDKLRYLLYKTMRKMNLMMRKRGH